MSPTPAIDFGNLAVVFTGGGARGAYQVGVLRAIARRFPKLGLPILSGVSAGAINAAYLGQHPGNLGEALADLAAIWRRLTPERIFRVEPRDLMANMGRWGLRLAGAGAASGGVRGLVDTAPLEELLGEVISSPNGEIGGIEDNLRRGTVRVVALGTIDYTTGQSVVWVQGRRVATWERPSRRVIRTRLRLEHVQASAALPLLFPAVQIGEHWHGDGGVRLTAPLSPALHLGARKILAISTRHPPTYEEADRPTVLGYPPPATILGVLYHAVFLDQIDEDVRRMELINELIRPLPERRRGGRRLVDLLVMRPSQDLGEIARGLEARLPRAFKLLTRGLGTRQSRSSDVLSLLMFQRDYVDRLLELGERDAEDRMTEIEAFLAPHESRMARWHPGRWLRIEPRT
jgi:NTE family protein